MYYVDESMLIKPLLSLSLNTQDPGLTNQQVEGELYLLELCASAVLQLCKFVVLNFLLQLFVKCSTCLT